MYNMAVWWAVLHSLVKSDLSFMYSGSYTGMIWTKMKFIPQFWVYNPNTKFQQYT
jgi:hypothetical protein